MRGMIKYLNILALIFISCSSDKEKEPVSPYYMMGALCFEESRCPVPCESDDGCQSNERCCEYQGFHICLETEVCLKGCSLDMECNESIGEICCNYQCKQQSDCSIKSCNIDSDCSSDQKCCEFGKNLHCYDREYCPQKCHADIDCNQNGFACCRGLCSESCVQECTSSDECSNSLMCCEMAISLIYWDEDVYNEIFFDEKVR